MCESLGFASPRHLLRELTSREITEWLAFYQVRKEKQEDAERQQKAQAKADEMARKMSRGG